MISVINSFFSKAYISKILTVLFIVFVATYALVPWLFFQQDEWLNFGLMISYGPDLILHRFAQEDINHLVPVNRLVGYTLFQLAGLNHTVYNLFGLAVHFINGLLIYSIVNFYLRNKMSAFVSSIIFLTSSVAAELVMWPVASIIMLALTFSLIAWKMVLDYQDSNTWFWLGLASSALIALALMNIEYAGGMILFIPLVMLLSRKRSIKRLAEFYAPFILVIAGYLLFRFSDSSHLPSATKSNYSINAVLLPFKYLGQLVLPSILLDNLLRWFAENIFWIKGLIYGTGAGLLVVQLLLALKLKSKNNDQLIYLFTVSSFIVASSLPFLVLVGSEPLSTLAPRYLYFGLAGIAAFFGLIVQLYKNIFIYGILILIIGLGIVGNWSREIRIYQESRERITVLNKIKSSYPAIGMRSIIYVASDSSYYGLPEDVRIMPFQSGFGQTLLVWYSFPQHYPKEIYRDRFLWEIRDQGYKEVSGYGFGYYREYPLLVDAVKKNNIAIENVYAFQYDSEWKTLENVSDRIRESLRHDQN